MSNKAKKKQKPVRSNKNNVTELVWTYSENEDKRNVIEAVRLR